MRKVDVAVSASLAGFCARVLEFFRKPLVRADMVALHHPPPVELGRLLELVGSESACAAMAATLGVTAEELREAVLFYLRQLLFKPEADHYRVLGLSPGAAAEQIRKHYRLLIGLFHPDRQVDADAWDGLYARRLNEAYNTLKNPAARAEYDRRLSRPGVLRERVVSGKTPVAWASRPRRPVVMPSGAPVDVIAGIPLWRRPLKRMVIAGLLLGGAFYISLAFLVPPVFLQKQQRSMTPGGAENRSLQEQVQWHPSGASGTGDPPVDVVVTAANPVGQEPAEPEAPEAVVRKNPVATVGSAVPFGEARGAGTGSAHGVSKGAAERSARDGSPPKSTPSRTPVRSAMPASATQGFRVEPAPPIPLDFQPESLLHRYVEYVQAENLLKTLELFDNNARIGGKTGLRHVARAYDRLFRSARQIRLELSLAEVLPRTPNRARLVLRGWLEIWPAEGGARRRSREALVLEVSARDRQPYILSLEHQVPKEP